MYAIFGNIYHRYTSNVSVYTIHGSYGYLVFEGHNCPGDLVGLPVVTSMG
jgi:hypothetical protein